MTRLLACLLIGLLRPVAGATPAQMSQASYAQDALDGISRTRMLSQKLTKEFYFFLFDVDRDKNGQLVREDMLLVEEGFTNFSVWIRTMTNEFDAKLDNLNATIAKFRSDVAAFSDVFSFDVTTTVTSTTNTLATTTSTTTTTMLRMYQMWPVETGSQAMKDQMTALWKEFTQYVLMNKIYNRLYAYDFVDRKRVLNQELGKFAVLRALGTMMPLGYQQDLSSHALAKLLYTMDSFTLGHYALLEGSPWLGNGMVPDVCLLYQTCVVTDQYEERVLPELRRVIYRLRQTPEDWLRLDEQINELLTAVVGNYWMLSVVEGTASPAGGLGRWNRGMECPWVITGVNGNGWLNAVSMLNNNRRVLQEIARIYLQIVADFDVVNRIDRLKLRREEFTTRMNRIIQGYTVENVPSPPTQDLSQALQDFMFKNWRPVDEIFRQAIQGKAKSYDGRLEGADNTTLLLLDSRVIVLESLFVEISSLYVRECPPALRQRCFMVQASYSQATAYERMVKEAWFCSLFENSTAFLQRFNYTKDNLTAATLRLVDGVVVNDEIVEAEHHFWAMKIRRHMAGYRTDPATRAIKKEFTYAWAAAGATDYDRKAAVQSTYITLNTETDKSHWMPPDQANFQSAYDIAHRTPDQCQYIGHGRTSCEKFTHTYWRTLLEYNNYADVYTFDLDGNCLYSVMKKSDFGENFKTGKYGTAKEDTWASTLLGRTLEKALENPDQTHESYWGKYPASGDTDAAFMCTGISAGDGTAAVIGIVCIQLPPEKGEDLPTTDSYCILNELYRVRRYETSLIALVESVVYPKNWTYVQMKMFTDAYFRDLAPQFVKVGNQYSQANPTCIGAKWLEEANIEQWRAAMSTASMLPSILPKVAKQYLVARKMFEFDTRPATIYMRGLNAQLESSFLTLGNNYLRDLRLGTLDAHLPAAPSQMVVNKDLDSLDAWENFIAFVGREYREENVVVLGNLAYDAMDVFRTLIDAFTTYARRSQHSIEVLLPDLLSTTGNPSVFIEKMAMEAAMLSLWQGSPTNLTESINGFEAAVTDLQSDPRTAQERCRVQAVSQLLDVWEEAKPGIVKFGVKFTYDEKQVMKMMNATESLFARADYMQLMYEERNPTCVLNDSGVVRSWAGMVAWLCGILVTARSAF